MPENPIRKVLRKINERIEYDKEVAKFFRGIRRSLPNDVKDRMERTPHYNWRFHYEYNGGNRELLLAFTTDGRRIVDTYKWRVDLLSRFDGSEDGGWKQTGSRFFNKNDESIPWDSFY